LNLGFELRIDKGQESLALLKKMEKKELGKDGAKSKNRMPDVPALLCNLGKSASSWVQRYEI
jgi:hypothetical protein